MKTLQLIAAALTALVLSGCELLDAPAPSRGLITTRFQDVQPGVAPPRRDSFGPGETPCLYVQGYGGQTVTAKIYDLSSGREVKRVTEYIPEGKDYHWWFSDLPSGSYRADLEIGGSVTHSSLFRVSR